MIIYRTAYNAMRHTLSVKPISKKAPIIYDYRGFRSVIQELKSVTSCRPCFYILLFFGVFFVGEKAGTPLYTPRW